MANDHMSFENLKNQIFAMKRTIPVLLANQAMNYFLSSFDKQGWNGESWQEVKRRIEGTPEYKYPLHSDLGRRTRAILIGKGSTRLRRAVNNSVKIAEFPTVLLEVDLPYARVHNEGNPARGIPKRQYMGQTAELTKMQIELINSEYAKLKP